MEYEFQNVPTEKKNVPCYCLSLFWMLLTLSWLRKMAWTYWIFQIFNFDSNLIQNLKIFYFALRKDMKSIIQWNICLIMSCLWFFRKGAIGILNYMKVCFWRWHRECRAFKKRSWALPWWSSRYESACHGFNPCSGKILHALRQLSPWVTRAEACAL